MRKNTQKSQTAPQSTGKSDFQFVKFELEEVELKKLKAWQPDLAEIDSLLEKFEEEGYNISFKMDTFNDCLACYATTKDVKSPNFNLCLSGRGSTPIKAFKQLIWKHHLSDGQWPHPEFSLITKTEFND